MKSVIDMPMVSINPSHPDQDTIRRAAAVLASGELVVAPTETRYGLLARGDSEAAVQRVFVAKGRKPLQPTALFVRDERQVRDMAELPPIAELLMCAFLPGPLTLVLTSRKRWGAPRVVDGLIGIRWSSSPIIRELMKCVDFPLTATSANLSGSSELDMVAQIREALGDSVALYLDGGALRGPASTVVKCVDDHMTILRAGAVPTDEITMAINTGGRSE